MNDIKSGEGIEAPNRYIHYIIPDRAKSMNTSAQACQDPAVGTKV